MSTVKDKWDRIYDCTDYTQVKAVSVLTENAFLLPPSGRALDLACGLGANALLLSTSGLLTEAWDISSVALGKLQHNASAQGLDIVTRKREIVKKSLNGQHFDVIVISYFLDRSLSDGIMRALNPGGLLFYQTYTRIKTSQTGPTNPDYLLAENELLHLFPALHIVYYRENGVLGNTDTGLRNETQFIGRKK